MFLVCTVKIRYMYDFGGTNIQDEINIEGCSDTEVVNFNAVLPKHTLFKVLYSILTKFKNYTLFILFFM